ncbi:MAG: 30S ribosomal protein S4 [Candidatus Woesearchaeota archaeon]
MGDPKRRRKKFQKPSHPWSKSRIEEEQKLIDESGFKNKREIWKLNSKLKGFKDQLKKLASQKSEQSQKEKELLMKRLFNLGLIPENATPDDVLALTIDGIIERRLQNIVVKKRLARTHKQARQFITHRHISVLSKKMTSPNYLVPIAYEDGITFSPNSKLANIDHPERFKETFTAEEKKEIAAEKPKQPQHQERRQGRGEFRGKSRRDPMQNRRPAGPREQRQHSEKKP